MARSSNFSERMLRIAERRLPALTRLKTAEPLPIALTRRRIYVLPTRFGLFFGFFLAAMTLGALNYNNNPALILCFLLASICHSSLLMAYLGLRGLRLIEVNGAPVHAGQPVHVRLRFDSIEARHRAGLVLRRGDTQTSFSLERDAQIVTQVALPTQRRGWLPVGRIEVSLRRPLGMFVVWSWLHPERRLLVYPPLETHAPPLPIGGDEGAPRRQRGPAEEVHGLRDYRVGDPLRSIAWKRSAQQARTLVREFESPAGREAILDWQTLLALPLEQRISRLARWVVEAERNGARYELRLPRQTYGPARGAAHRNACLRALALLDESGESP